MQQPPPETDFARFRAMGDVAALGRVFDRVAPELLLVAAHVAPEASLAEDLVQATFLHAIRDAARWDARRRLLPWLIGILTHLALKERERARVPDPHRLAPRRAPPLPPDAAAAEEFARALAAALDELPAHYRQPLVLRLVHGMGLAEIAHALGLPPLTVKTRLQRGMALLRRALPAGFAAALVLTVLPVRGLAAVREAVVGAAADLAGGGAAAARAAAAVPASPASEEDC